jgi:hypothetical protein
MELEAVSTAPGKIVIVESPAGQVGVMVDDVDSRPPVRPLAR